MIVDTHVHLNDVTYADNLEKVIKDANASGVLQMIVIGIDKQTSIQALEIAKRFDGVYCAVGIHPSEVKNADDDLLWIEELAKDKKVVAIGEIGLDYYWDKTYKEKQIAFFRRQIDIALRLGLPISVHSREATQDTYDILKTSGVTGVMHCYSGSLEMAREFIKIGFYLGIGGVLTFKNAKLREVVEQIPLDFLLTETDAPYLAPHPFRGKTNYPQYTRLVVEEIARIKNLDVDQVTLKLKENTMNVFGI